MLCRGMGVNAHYAFLKGRVYAIPAYVSLCRAVRVSLISVHRPALKWGQ